MLDPQLKQLLENAINTSCKLAVVLRFLDHRTLCVTPGELAARLCRDIWSVESALNELVDDGILTRRDRRFVCEPAPEMMAALQLLRETYAHPLLRDELQQRLRDLERYAPYRNVMPSQFFAKLAA